MNVPKPIELLRKHRLGTLTDEERMMLESWYADYAKSGQRPLAIHEQLPERLNDVWNRLLEEAEGQLVEREPIRIPWRWMGVAASVLLVICLRYFTASEPGSPGLPGKYEVVSPSDIAPGASRAYLTLSDGKTIDLEKDESGLLASEGTVEIVKSKEGELLYRKAEEAQVVGAGFRHNYNKVTTPKAGEYRIRLEDGTLVWLNAGSSLRFPTVFSGNERLVELDGEAYFEVSRSEHKGKKVAFKVKSGQQTIEVLGTRFNVKSYPDEKEIKTTLVEGSIKVNFSSSSEKGILLKPGQQLRYVESGRKGAGGLEQIKVNAIDTASAVAWKNGYFSFDNVGLEDMMGQICRWYDMDVIYEGGFNAHKFVGRIHRSASLGEVLSILEVGDLSFRIQQKNIVVKESDQ